MAPHSSTLAWKNPMDGGAWWAAVHRVVKSGTRLSDFTFTFIHWRRKWQPTPVFLPGESQGQGSLVGCRLWGHTELDMTEATLQQQQQQGDSGFPGGSEGKESACNAGDPGLIPGFGTSPGEGNGNLLQYSCLYPMDRGAWQATVHGVAGDTLHHHIIKCQF